MAVQVSRPASQLTRRTLLSAGAASIVAPLLAPADHLAKADDPAVPDSRRRTLSHTHERQPLAMTDHSIALPGGRALAYSEAGDPAGMPVYWFHGAPGSRLGLFPWARQFGEYGIRVISIDRPGYGGSSLQPGWSRASAPDLLSYLAERLGTERFAVSGHSSGGPYALECAARLGDRVTGAVVIAGVADMGWPEAWNGFPETEAALMRLADVQSVTERCVELFGADGSRFFDAPGPALSSPDAALFADETFVDAMTATMDEAFKQGVAGYAQDVVAQRKPWTFDPRTIRSPVIVAHGGVDAIVPTAHGRHTAGLVPGASLRIFPDDGHISILNALPDFLLELKRG